MGKRALPRRGTSSERRRPTRATEHGAASGRGEGVRGARAVWARKLRLCPAPPPHLQALSALPPLPEIIVHGSARSLAAEDVLRRKDTASPTPCPVAGFRGQSQAWWHLVSNCSALRPWEGTFRGPSGDRAMTLPVRLTRTRPRHLTVLQRAFSLPWPQRAEVWWLWSASCSQGPPLEQPGVLGSSPLGLPKPHSRWACSIFDFTPLSEPLTHAPSLPAGPCLLPDIAPGAGVRPASPPQPPLPAPQGRPVSSGQAGRPAPRLRLPRLPHHALLPV